jgi:hypothetical protein
MTFGTLSLAMNPMCIPTPQKDYVSNSYVESTMPASDCIVQSPYTSVFRMIWKIPMLNSLAIEVVCLYVLGHIGAISFLPCAGDVSGWVGPEHRGTETVVETTNLRSQTAFPTLHGIKLRFQL